ncbi:MAG: hypothetical protein M3O02_13230 [Acidobacteriota bacterium]|nr:hypothetical protein [Acidobacteriota bacterium]
MFELLFKYPIPVFSKGSYILLAAWPAWVLALLIVDAGIAFAWLTWRRLPGAAPRLRSWRAWALWGMQTGVVSLLLLLLWEPAVSVAELKSQQNIIAVLLDDSRSMGLADAGSDGKAVREAEAQRALARVLPGLEKKFQVRAYRLDGALTRMEGAGTPRAEGGATHIGEGLRQLLAETSDLPLGGVVLATDGAENSGGIDLDTISQLRNRRIPVHTIGFGQESAADDLEIDDVNVAPRGMAGSRMSAAVHFHQRGYAGRKTTLEIREGDKPIASREVVLGADGAAQSETVLFSAGAPGVKTLTFSLAVLAGEQSTANNALTRLLDVSGEKRRILYVEGEPRWEYKFLRRAEEADKGIQVVSMLRTTENKIYRQGIADPGELAEGFPTQAVDLFRYQAIIVGSVEAGYFTPGQQELLREFVDRRGGGVLFLGGRYALSEGGWGTSGAADLLPTFLPSERGSFHRAAATVELTAAGAESPITRLVDEPGRNVDRWKKLPYLADYQTAGTPKPGATVLAGYKDPGSGRTLPLLVTERYGRGRTALLATSGTWRWQMSSPLGDQAHDLFWQQLLRWLAEESPGAVSASPAQETLSDHGHVHLTAMVRDGEFMPAAEARVAAHIVGPEGISGEVEMAPEPNTPGVFQVDWTAEKAGSYVAEVSAARAAEGGGTEELGRDAVTFRREDGVAENFHTGQNRELLQKLSSETGGRYWTEGELSRLPQEITYSEAGLSVRDTKELWNMPIVFLLLLGLLAAEWLLRRKWGVV